MAYTPTQWVNGQPPALNAANLNNMENGIKNTDILATKLDEEFSENIGKTETIFSANKYNRAVEQIGVRLFANGSTTNVASFRTSGYIDVTEIESGYINPYIYNVSQTTSYCFAVVFYDENKTRISGVDASGTSPFNITAQAVPEGAEYARVCLQYNANWDSQGLLPMVVDGQSRITYVDYSETKIFDPVVLYPMWRNKKWVSYGDSITAIGNDYPTSWQRYVKEYFKMGDFYGRGVGSQTFEWNAKPWFANSDGSFNSRDDNGSMLDPGSYVVPSGCTAHYGYFCSWDRITTMIPESIRTSIDLITVFGVNDNFQPNVTPLDISTSARSIVGGVRTIGIPYYQINSASGAYTLVHRNINDANSNFLKLIPTATLEQTHATDKAYDMAWAAATDFNTFGGDFEIAGYENIDNAVASCIMKLQAWCPNARIVFGTSWSGKGDFPNPANGVSYSADQWKQFLWGEEVKAICGYFSIPVVDLWKTSGVNCLNRSIYNSDGLHPYTEAGKKALAKCWIGGLSAISPNL